MLLALIQWLADSTSLGWLRVFNYLTLRAVLAALTAFFIALALGPAVIRELRNSRSVRLFVSTDRRAIWSKKARRPWAASLS